MKGYDLNTLLPKAAYFINLVILTIPLPQIKKTVSKGDYRVFSENQNIHKERLLAFYDAFIHP